MSSVFVTNHQLNHSKHLWGCFGWSPLVFVPDVVFKEIQINGCLCDPVSDITQMYSSYKQQQDGPGTLFDTIKLILKKKHFHEFYFKGK